jgi:hypothetical protein
MMPLSGVFGLVYRVHMHGAYLMTQHQTNLLLLPVVLCVGHSALLEEVAATVPASS